MGFTECVDGTTRELLAKLIQSSCLSIGLDYVGGKEMMMRGIWQVIAVELQRSYTAKVSQSSSFPLYISQTELVAHSCKLASVNCQYECD